MSMLLVQTEALRCALDSGSLRGEVKGQGLCSSAKAGN